ncbi:MAG: hypothetical protein B7Z20_07740, partial [Sphingobium sp. 32-64-5]
LAALLEQRGMWEERRATARAFVERERNWTANIKRYQPVYENLLQGGKGHAGPESKAMERNR